MKAILAAVLIVGVPAASAAGREWTARAGGYTVEAELVDVKDGKAILKRKDGTEVAVPLNKLSLGDVRYVNETLAAADAEIAGKKEKPSAVRPVEKPAASESWESPLKQPNHPSKDAAGEPSADPGQWGSETELTVDDPSEVAFGPPGCPVVLAGTQIWDAAKRRIRGNLEGERKAKGMATISPDGSWIATADKTPNMEDTPVTVYDGTTGKRRFTVPGDAKRYVDVIFLSNDRLFLGGRQDGQLLIWNLQTGQEEKALNLPDRLDKGKVGFTPDGKYLAMPAKNRMVVIRAETGNVVATMAPPKAMERSMPPQQEAGPKPIRAPGRSNKKSVARLDSSDAVFVFAWLQSVNFSPDAKELAVVSTHPKPRLICWNSGGKLVYDEPFYDDGRAFWENTLQWFPDRTAWVVAGDIVDRESGRIVMSIRKPFGKELAIHVLDADHLLGTLPDNLSQIKVLPIPWQQIRQSLALMKEKGAALLSPAEPVSVKIELGELRGAQDETLAAIRSSLTMRLARDGMQLAEGRPTYFRLKFSEKAGDQLPIYQRQSPFDLRGSDTGRRATEANGTLIVELMVPGQAEPIWRDTISAISSRSFTSEITDASVRASMLDNLSRSLSLLNIPYFIPKSEKVLALPVVLVGQ